MAAHGQIDLLDHLHEAIIATDVHLCITAWNQTAAQTYGYTAAEVLGRPLAAVIRSDVDQQQRDEALKELHANDELLTEITQYQRDGTPLHHMEEKMMTIRDDAGNISGYVSVYRDISNRKRLENLLNRRVRQAETSSEICQLISDVGLDYQAVLDVVAQKITEAIGDMCVVTVMSDDGQWLTPVTYYHPDPQVHAHIGHLYAQADQPVDSVVGQVVRDGRPLMIPSLTTEEADNFVTAAYKEYLASSNMYGLMIVPLTVKKQVIGTLGISRITPGRPYTNVDLEFLQVLAAQVAMGIQNARLHEKVRHNRDTLQLLTGRIVTAQEEERRRISRELHDKTSQALTVLRIKLEQLQSVDDLSLLPDKVSQLLTLTDQTMDNIHTLAENLRPPEIDTLRLTATLEEYCVDFAEQTGLAITFTAEEIPLLTDVIRITFYRVLQEALTNVVRHAEATTVSVTLVYQNQELVLRIKDNGQGFDASAVLDARAAYESLGLLGMRERLENLGGRLSVITRPGQGTTLAAHIPSESTL